MELTPEIRAKRVAIAADVLKQLEMKALNVQCGSYVEFNDDGTQDGIVDWEAQAQPRLDELQPKCHVCAMGAVLLSYVRIHNRLPLSRVFDIPAAEDLVDAMDDVFDEFTLRNMEAAFEGVRYGKCVKYTYNAVSDFFELHLDNAERLRVIMENLIRNDGEFVFSEELQTSDTHT